VHKNFADKSICLLADNIRNEVDVNAVTLHVDIPRAGGRCPGLSFEAFPQEY
jgi:hypothetical protein